MQLENINVEKHEVLITPEHLKAQLPVNEQIAKFVTSAREDVARIVRAEDPRMLVVVGPCSIHDTKAALEYAERLAALRDRVDDRLCLVMRAYFEKP